MMSGKRWMKVASAIRPNLLDKVIHNVIDEDKA